MATIFCTHCGNQVPDDAYACMKCGCRPRSGKAHCYNCGVNVRQEQVICIKCGVRLDSVRNPTQPPLPPKRKPDQLSSMIFAILFGFTGMHKFYMGYPREGFVMLSLSVIGSLVWLKPYPIVLMMAVAWIEASSIICRDEASFIKNYIDEQRPWF